MAPKAQGRDLAPEDRRGGRRRWRAESCTSSPMQVLRKVFPLVIREPCVPQQTSSQTRNKGTTLRLRSGCGQGGEYRNLGRSSKSSLWRKSRRKPVPFCASHIYLLVARSSFPKSKRRRSLLEREELYCHQCDHGAGTTETHRGPAANLRRELAGGLASRAW